jgi:hypothetical protein
MLGSATLTIVMSTSSISSPRQTDSNVHHLRAIACSVRASSLLPLETAPA